MNKFTLPLCLVALVAGGFLFSVAADSAEAGHRSFRHRGGHHHFHGHRNHGHRHFGHRGHNHRSYGHNYGFNRYSHSRYVAPVKYLWCDIHDCYYYINSYGVRQYIR